MSEVVEETKIHDLPKPETVEQQYLAAILEMQAFQAQLLQTALNMIAPALAQAEPEPEAPKGRTVRLADGSVVAVVGL